MIKDTHTNRYRHSVHKVWWSMRINIWDMSFV